MIFLHLLSVAKKISANGISIYISELINIIYKTKNDAQPAGAPSFIAFHTCPPGKGWHRFIIGLGNISL
jgi:hypothetical protein